jgi:hypothetical protein
MTRQASDKTRARVAVFEAIVQGWLSFLSGMMAIYLLFDEKWLAIFPIIMCPLGAVLMWARIIEAGVYYRRANRLS